MKAKPYKAEEAEIQKVEEPVVAYSLQEIEGDIEKECYLSYDEKLEKWEQGNELLHLISTPSLLDKALATLTSIVKEEKRSPTQFTIEELKRRLEISAEQAKRGEGIPHDEVVKMMKEWMK